MKLLFLVLALTSSALFAAAPPAAAPAPAEPAAAPALLAPPPAIERQMLARRYVSLAVSPDQFLDMFRSGLAAGVSEGCSCGDDKKQATKAEADARMKHFLALYEPKVRERLPNLMEAYATVYAREFSADDLKAMIAFAQSPAGQHYLARMPVIETDPIVQMQVEGFMLDLAPIMRQLEKEDCAEHTAQRIAAGDKNAKCPLADKAETQAG